MSAEQPTPAINALTPDQRERLDERAASVVFPEMAWGRAQPILDLRALLAAYDAQAARLAAVERQLAYANAHDADLGGGYMSLWAWREGLAAAGVAMEGATGGLPGA